MASESFRTRIKGFRETITKLTKLKEAHVEGFKEGLTEGVFLIFRVSQELVPVEFGVLRASGDVDQPYKGKSGFGGFQILYRIRYTASYAIYVHERTDLAHGFRYNLKYADDIAAGTKTARGPRQQAKFLETAFRRNVDKVISLIKQRMKEHSQRTR